MVYGFVDYEFRIGRIYCDLSVSVGFCGDMCIESGSSGLKVLI